MKRIIEKSFIVRAPSEVAWNRNLDTAIPNLIAEMNALS